MKNFAIAVIKASLLSLLFEEPSPAAETPLGGASETVIGVRGGGSDLDRRCFLSRWFPILFVPPDLSGIILLRHSSLEPGESGA